MQDVFFPNFTNSQHAILRINTPEIITVELGISLYFLCVCLYFFGQMSIFFAAISPYIKAFQGAYIFSFD